MPASEPRQVVAWEFRFVQRLGLSAPGTGVAISAVLLGLYFASSWALGFSLSSSEEILVDPARDTIYACLLIGYAFAALRLGAAGIENDLVRVGIGPDGDLGQGSFPVETLRRSRWAGALGVGAAFALIELVAASQGFEMHEPWAQVHQTTFFLYLLLFLFWLMGRAAAFTLQGSSYAAGVSGAEVQVDLLDLRPLNAFGRIGLRFALLWLLGVTLAAPMLLGPSLELGPLLLAFAIAGSLATVALMIPVLGVRRRIRSVKQEELAYVAAAIAGDDAAVSKTRIAARGGRIDLADLIAYRGLVEAAPEWPYDVPTLSRFGLYLLIPLASWVAAALVERGVDALLR